MTKKLGKYYWVRVGVMMITLIGIISLLYALNNPNSPGLLALLGLDPTRVGVNAIKLCPTRVSSISVIGKAAIFQDNMKWYRTGSGEREELDSLSVERWFSEYCTVRAEPKPKPSDNSTPILTLAYVAGLPVTVQRSSAGVYTWNGYSFESAKLSQAIEALSAIPTAEEQPNK